LRHAIDGFLQEFLHEGRQTFETVLSVVQRFESNEFGLIGQIIPMIRVLVMALEAAPPILEAYARAALNKYHELDAKHSHQRTLLYIASLLHPWGILQTWSVEGGTLPNAKETQIADERIVAELKKMESPRHVARATPMSLDERAVPGSVQRPTADATQSPTVQWRLFKEMKVRLQANPTELEKTYRRKPEEFWKLHEKDLCFVYRLAVHTLAMECTSVQSERFFSICDLILSARRSRLTTKHFAMLALLKADAQAFCDQWLGEGVVVLKPEKAPVQVAAKAVTQQQSSDDDDSAEFAQDGGLA
jgi:hypothetical protein